MLSPASQKDAAYAAMLQEADAVMSRELMLALSYQGSIPQGVLPFMKKIGLLGGDHPAEPASGCDDVAAGRPGRVLG